MNDEATAEALRLRPFWDRAKRDRGMTQEVLADKMSVTQGAIHKWLTGKQLIPDKRLIELGGLLGFDPIAVRPSLAMLMIRADLSVTEEALILARAIEALDPASREALRTLLKLP